MEITNVLQAHVSLQLKKKDQQFPEISCRKTVIIISSLAVWCIYSRNVSQSKAHRHQSDKFINCIVFSSYSNCCTLQAASKTWLTKLPLSSVQHICVADEQHAHCCVEFNITFSSRPASTCSNLPSSFVWSSNFQNWSLENSVFQNNQQYKNKRCIERKRQVLWGLGLRCFARVGQVKRENK